MPFAPGHFQRAHSQQADSQQAHSQQAQSQQAHSQQDGRRYRSRREFVAVRVAAMIALVLAGLLVYALTTHQRSTGHGCIDFNYSTMIGGAEKYACGAQARELCATPPSRNSIDGDFQTELYAACRKAGIPTGRS